ncbi:hypothetical protein IFR05_000990 [Cadophora sp. M221]|nr:hypothetical protein IFR05_000990 [Cadophora sp. M221]
MAEKRSLDALQPFQDIQIEILVIAFQNDVGPSAYKDQLVPSVFSLEQQESLPKSFASSQDIPATPFRNTISLEHSNDGVRNCDNEISLTKLPA